MSLLVFQSHICSRLQWADSESFRKWQKRLVTHTQTVRKEYTLVQPNPSLIYSGKPYNVETRCCLEKTNVTPEMKQRRRSFMLKESGLLGTKWVAIRKTLATISLDFLPLEMCAPICHRGNTASQIDTLFVNFQPIWFQSSCLNMDSWKPWTQILSHCNWTYSPPAPFDIVSVTRN